MKVPDKRRLTKEVLASPFAEELKKDVPETISSLRSLHRRAFVMK